jgi:hypothetical protein
MRISERAGGMRRLLAGLTRPSTIMPIVGILFVAWVVLSQFIPQNQLAIVTNGLYISGAIGINSVYLPLLFASLRSPEPLPDQYFCSGLLLFTNAIAASRVWSLAIILAGKPDWMINYPVQSLCYLLAALSLLFFLKIPGPSKAGWRYPTMMLIFTVMIVSLWLAYVEGH